MSNNPITVDILRRIRGTMEDVIALEKSFDIGSYYVDTEAVENETTVHNCGTAACVVGYCALDKNRFSKELDSVSNRVGYNRPTERAQELWNVFENLCELPELDSYALFGSLFKACEYERSDCFEALALGTANARRFSHLREFEPTPEDVIELLDYYIEELSKDEVQPS